MDTVARAEQRGFRAEERPWTIFRMLTFTNSLFVGITAPLQVIFLSSIGFSPARIGILLAVNALGVLLGDVPTGAFADRHGRRASLLISFTTLALVFLGWTFAQNFLVFTLLSLCWGIGYAFQSGAKTALLMEHLGPSGESEQRRTFVFARLAVYGNAGLFLGGLVAAVIAGFSLRWIWAAAALLHVCMAALVWFGIRHDRQREKNEPRFSIRRVFADTLGGVRTTVRIMPFPLLILLGATSTLLLSAYGIAMPLFLRERWSVSDEEFGVLGSVAALMGVLGAFLGERLHRRHGTLGTSALFALALFGSIAALTAVNALWFVLVCYAFIELFLFG